MNHNKVHIKGSYFHRYMLLFLPFRAPKEAFKMKQAYFISFATHQCCNVGDMKLVEPLKFEKLRLEEHQISSYKNYNSLFLAVQCQP